MTDKIRIAMWAGPRNISTTIMRSFENRPDMATVDEPFYACYLSRSGADHPMREEILAAQPTEWREVIASFDETPPGGEPGLFEKHIAFHFPDDLSIDWLYDHRVFLLIRDPRAMIASYSQKFDDVAPIADSFKVQRRIFNALTERGQPCPVIDSKDVLLNPEGVLRKLCAALDLSFSDKMLSWPKGARASDGVWGSHWYDAVVKSTGFLEYHEKEVTLPPALESVADLCAPQYEFFHRRRLKA